MIGEAPNATPDGLPEAPGGRYCSRVIVGGFPEMPIYVFRCSECGEKFDHLQKLSDTDPDVCPNCGKHQTLHRQMTAPAFRLAGSGWYETDFKSKREHKYNLAGDHPPVGRVVEGASAPDGAKAAASSGGRKASDASAAVAD